MNSSKLAPVATVDFRSARPIDWTALNGKGKLQRPVRVQTPLCNCNVRTDIKGHLVMYKVSLLLSDDVQLHREFLDWLGQVEHGALEAAREGALRALVTDTQHRACVFRRHGKTVTELWLTVFGDTEMWGPGNKLSSRIMEPPAASMRCLLEIQGVWVANGKWGVRLAVKSLKFNPDPADLPIHKLKPDPVGDDDVKDVFLLSEEDE